MIVEKFKVFDRYLMIIVKYEKLISKKLNILCHNKLFYHF